MHLSLSKWITFQRLVLKKRNCRKQWTKFLSVSVVYKKQWSHFHLFSFTCTHLVTWTKHAHAARLFVSLFVFSIRIKSKTKLWNRMPMWTIRIVNEFWYTEFASVYFNAKPKIQKNTINILPTIERVCVFVCVFCEFSWSRRKNVNIEISCPY